MNKSEFCARLGEKGYSKRDASQVYNDFIETLRECLADGEDVRLRGFGDFRVMRYSSRKCTNYRTGETVIAEERDIVRFKPATLLKDAVRYRSFRG